MNRTRLILLIIAALLLSAIICLPDWFEDPRQLAQGEWKDAGRKGTVVVTDNTVTLLGFGPEEPIPYTWVQTEQEPYTMLLSYDSYRIEVNIIFNGDNEAIALPEVMHYLPADIAETLRRKNRSAGRPENEFSLLFRRVLPKN